MALPAFDKNGKAAGIWLSPLTDRDGRLEAIGGEGRIMGNEDARFVALQNSRNGESLLAGNMGEGVRMARDNPDTGVVVRLAGDDRPWNPGAMTGGRVWAEPAPVAPVPQAGADIILPPEVLAQRAAEEQQRREMEKQAEQTAREVAGEARKAGEPADRVKEVIGDVIRGLERDRPGTEKTTLPDDPQFRRQEAAIQQVASESLQRERLQAVERDMVRDLNREKTSGATDAPAACLPRQPPVKPGTLPGRGKREKDTERQHTHFQSRRPLASAPADLDTGSNGYD